MKISVVIPCYNGQEFLPETLASVFAQTLRPHEVWVVDDASTDDSVEVARKAGAEVIRCDVNRGEAAVRNVGIERSSAEWVALLDADDLWLPHHLQSMADLIQAHPEADLAWGRCELFGDRHHLTRITIPPNETSDAFRHAVRVNLAQPSAAVVRRQTALELGGFDLGFRYGADFDFWVRLTRDHRVVCTHDVTARYRWHAGGISRRVNLTREGQHRSRLRMFAALEPEKDAARRAYVEQTMLEEWQKHLADAWMDGDPEMFDMMLALKKYVPGSEPIARRWKRFRPWFGLRRRWNRLPDPVRGRFKRILGRSGTPA